MVPTGVIFVVLLLLWMYHSNEKARREREQEERERERRLAAARDDETIDALDNEFSDLEDKQWTAFHETAGSWLWRLIDAAKLTDDAELLRTAEDLRTGQHDADMDGVGPRGERWDHSAVAQWWQVHEQEVRDVAAKLPAGNHQQWAAFADRLEKIATKTGKVRARFLDSAAPLRGGGHSVGTAELVQRYQLRVEKLQNRTDKLLEKIEEFGDDE